MKRAAIYVRVSTSGQTTENQRRQLRAVARRRGWKIVATYEDAGISGAKGRGQRPGFDRMLREATAGKFDILAAWSVDRLGRSLQDLIGFLSELHGTGRDLYLHQQAIDTSTPSGKAMYQMLGVFAEFELSMIRERVNAGIRTSESQGNQTRAPADRTAARAAHSGAAQRRQGYFEDRADAERRDQRGSAGHPRANHLKNLFERGERPRGPQQARNLSAFAIASAV